MVETNQLRNHLSKAFCTKCGTSLDTAKLVPVSELPLVVVAHAECIKCKSENMVTITNIGAGVMPMASDLTSEEIAHFIRANNVKLEDVVNIHNILKEESICSLMLKEEQNLEKIQKN